jgi:hypothetical protein
MIMTKPNGPNSNSALSNQSYFWAKPNIRTLFFFFLMVILVYKMGQAQQFSLFIFIFCHFLSATQAKHNISEFLLLGRGLFTVHIMRFFFLVFQKCNMCHSLLFGPRPFRAQVFLDPIALLAILITKFQYYTIKQQTKTNFHY